MDGDGSDRVARPAIPGTSLEKTDVTLRARDFSHFKSLGRAAEYVEVKNYGAMLTRYLQINLHSTLFLLGWL